MRTLSGDGPALGGTQVIYVDLGYWAISKRISNQDDNLTSVFKAHRLLYHSTLVLRVIKKKRSNLTSEAGSG